MRRFLSWWSHHRPGPLASDFVLALLEEGVQGVRRLGGRPSVRRRSPARSPATLQGRPEVHVREAQDLLLDPRDVCSPQFRVRGATKLFESSDMYRARLPTPAVVCAARRRSRRACRWSGPARRASHSLCLQELFHPLESAAHFCEPLLIGRQLPVSACDVAARAEALLLDDIIQGLRGLLLRRVEVVMMWTGGLPAPRGMF